MDELQSIFLSYAETIETEVQVKENLGSIIKNLEKVAHSMITILERIHSQQGFQKLELICEECNEVIKKVPPLFAELKEKIPHQEYFRYHYQFRWPTQKCIYAVALLSFLQENRLATYEQVAEQLGLSTKSEDGLHLELEDYLLSTLSLGSELARLAVNSVSAGDYGRPFQINNFLRELHSAYSLLNPKHEIRKKFDELKYSLKKTEEIVYNLTLRGLKPQDAEAEDTSG